MRYHVLKIENTLTKIAVGLGLVLASYLASGLVNASPVTQPALEGPRTRGLILTAPAQPATHEIPADFVDPPQNNQLEVTSSPIHSL